MNLYIRLPVQYRQKDTRGRRHPYAKGLNVSRLAEDVGISPGYLSALLKGMHMPRLPTAIKLSKTLGMTVEELMQWLEWVRERTLRGEKGLLIPPPVECRGQGIDSSFTLVHGVPEHLK